jgi:hypothetical protein
MHNCKKWSRSALPILLVAQAMLLWPVSFALYAPQRQPKPTLKQSLPAQSQQQSPQPSKAHPVHKYTSELLFHPSAISRTTTGSEGAVCKECGYYLHKKQLPKLALVNNMGIGNVPSELAALTLPEQILIARHFPTTNIIKLYPQKNGVQSGNCALCSNVSMYRLNTEEIADMVGGNIMPNPSKLLASMIRVTIIGPKNIWEKTMPDFLWVHRERVHKALVWLRTHNPMYANIVNKVPFSNPTVKTLQQQLLMVKTKVMGTDKLQIRIRGQIKGMKVMKGPPSLWITINPSNVRDPITQVIRRRTDQLGSI